VKKLSYFLSSFVVSLIIISNAFSQGSIVAKSGPKTTLSAPKSAKVVTVEKIEQDVAEALSVIESNHVVGKKMNYNDVFKSSIDGMLHTLDPHSNYFDAKEFEQFRTDQSSRYYGIGATIGDLSDPKGNVIATYIKATFDNAPAHRAGLRYGDKIIEVNGTSMLGKPFSDVRNFLRGPRGTQARLVIERYATGKRETVDIIRDAVSQPSISEAYMIRPGTGYIAMTGGFNQTTYAEFAQAMKTLKARGMKQLVLDLKNNGGGLVREAYRVASTFLDSGQIVFTQKGRYDGATEQSFRAENSNPERMPVVVLVNRNSASASEILAGALQDHDRALIVGENTFGKGLVQNPFVIEPYGSMLLLTIAKYETPAGRLIQRDYSNGELYDYYTNGGVKADGSEGRIPRGPESKTDAGRSVYSGGGITPDVELKPETITIERARFQQKLFNPVFAFALDLTAGRIKGFETNRVDQPIVFEYDIKDTDFPVSEGMYQAFKSFAIEKYKYTPAQIDREREFIERGLRSELVTAAFGSTTSLQVSNEYDNQLKKAIELLPQAKQLALDAARAKASALKEQTLSNR
jgi:carboxyl-terminal processing protease